MNTAKTVQILLPTEAAYIAALIDGEGTITLTRPHRNSNRQLAITISSTERCLLDFVIGCTNVGKITNKRKSQQHHKSSFVYALHNRQALQLLAQIQPYLKSYKARRAEMVLAEYLAVTPRNGKYNEELIKERERFEQRFFAIKP
jgi:hypothetical protein